jgi:hypothetical protein
VTGIRKDPYANANRIEVEVAKTGDERGKYLNPEAWGVSETLGVDYELKKFTQEEVERSATADRN